MLSAEWVMPGTEGHDGPKPGDERLNVSFDFYPVYNPEKSKAAGRQIFDSVEFIRIVLPGMKDVLHVAANESHKRRFARQYQAFKMGQAQDVSGTPITVLAQTVPPILNVGQVAELKYANVFTVEQLAEIPEGSSLMRSFMGINGLRQKARDFLAVTSANANFEEMRSELLTQKAHSDNLEKLLKEQAEQLAELKKATKR